MTTSTTEYRLSRRRARTVDGEGGGVEEQQLVAPEELASGSQRIEARVAPPLLDPWSSFDAETDEIDLPDLAVPPAALTRTKTEPMPADELALALAASSETMDNAATLSGFSAAAGSGVSIDPTPVTAVGFGDQQILVVHREDAVELILPGGQRLTASRAGAMALAEALLRDVTSSS